MAGERSGKSSADVRAWTRSGGRARAGGPLLAAASLAACIVAGLVASGATASADSAARPEPPTATEAKRWEAELLRSEGGGGKLVPPAAAAKRAGRRLFPQNRVLSLYGAAGGFGVLGRKSLKGAARKLRDQIKPYRKRSHKPVLPAFDLVAVIATRCANRRDKCRIRVGEETISRYLNKIRNLGGRLILDIQPGRANVLDEIDHLRPFIRQPDVDVAIDAEWNVGPRGEPGEDLGKIQAKLLNEAIREIRHIQERRDLPPKLLIVHQFQKQSVRKRSRVKSPGNVDVTINFDGIGSPAAKRAGYRNVNSTRLFNGFSLFYKLDSDLMKPKAVLGLSPSPNYLMYQ